LVKAELLGDGILSCRQGGVLLREEILATIDNLGLEEFKKRVFDGFCINQEEEEALLSSISSGHHILMLGPPGSGKTAIANKIAAILDDIEVVEGCLLNCPPQNASCPWCLEKKSHGILLEEGVLPASERVKRVQGSGGLTAEDLIGDLDPEAAFTQGIYSLGSFIPGKLLRANRGILLIDFIDRVPERVLNTILYALQGGEVSIGAFEENISLDILVIATGSEKALKFLPLDIIDFFDVVKLGYIEGHDNQKQIVLNNLERQYHGVETITDGNIEKVIEIVNQTRQHPEVERGVSTRGMIKYSEVLASYSQFVSDGEEELLHKGASVSLPHRLGIAPEVDLPGKRKQIVNEVVNKVVGAEEVEKELVTLSKDDILALVEGIVQEERIRKPLKYGAFDLLLRRVQQFPESKFAQIYKEAIQRLQELYPERYKVDNLTDELLMEVEEERKRKERINKALQKEALSETLKFLEEQDIIERSATGWTLSQRGITFLLEKLTPRLDEGVQFYGYGKHSTGKKLTLGEGKVVGVRHFRFGDRYRDVSFKDTIREALRNRRRAITREDIMVNIKDIHTKLNMILLIDLSGTMRQLQKLWYAKESAIALALAATRYGDNVGVVSFSNLADVVVDLTSNPYRVTRQVLDLELHENAFTNIGYGILKTCDLLAHHPKGKAKQHIILISDGDATAPHPSPEKSALRQAAMAVRRGITISCICITQESSNPELMRRIARIGKGRIYIVGAEELTTTLLEEAAMVHAS